MKTNAVGADTTPNELVYSIEEKSNKIHPLKIRTKNHLILSV